MTSEPRFIYIDAPPTKDDIRQLLHELVKSTVTDQSKKLLARLATTLPAERMAYNFGKTMEILAKRTITQVLHDGLDESELAAVVELDRHQFSLCARRAAHALLNMKERWLFVKAVGGMFRHSRAEDGYIAPD